MSAFFDRIWFQAAAGGTGAFTVSSAVTGFRTPAGASIPDGTILTYVAESSDKTQWEIGEGAYTASGTTLARTKVRAGTNGLAAVNFSVAPSVFIDLAAAEVFPARNLDSFTNTVTNFQISHETTGTPAVGIGTGLAFATETANDNVEIGAIIEAVTTTVTAAAENFDLRFKTMNAGAVAAERMRIDNAGRVNIGNAGAHVSIGAFTNMFEVSANTNATEGAALLGYGNGNLGFSLQLAKSRGATAAANTIVASDDSLGMIEWRGNDGVTYIQAAAIMAKVDGTPGANDMPARLSFFTTPDNSDSSIERMRISSTGHVAIAYAGGSSLHDGVAVGLNVTGNGNVDWIAEFRGYGNHATGTEIIFSKTRGATPATHAAVTANNNLAALVFRASDGTNFENAAEIRVGIDGTPAANDMPGVLQFSTTPSGSNVLQERLRIDQAGRATIGGGAQFSLDGFSRTHIAETDATALWNLAITTNGDPGTITPAIAFGLSRHATKGSHTIVQNSDTLGELVFYGSNGTAYARAARILAKVDGTPGAGNDMPGRIMFETSPDGTASPVERLRIPSVGGFIMPEITAPAAPAANNLHIYVLDVAGVTKLAVKDSAGTETVLGAGGAGGTPGGSNTQVQYNDGGAFGGDSSFLWDETNKRLTVGGGATYQAIFDGSAVSGSNPAGFSLKNGSWEIRFRTNPSIGWFEITDSSGAPNHRWHATDYLFQSGGILGWSSESNYATAGVGARDLALVRDGSGALAQRNGVNAQTFRVYNTFTDASNYERFAVQWASNVLTIGLQAAGTGTNVRQVVYNLSSGSSIDCGQNNFQIKNTSGTSKYAFQVTSTPLFGLTSDNTIQWTNGTTDPINTADIGIKRNAAGVLEINNGTAGAYRDLLCRSIERTGRLQDTVQTLTDGATPALDASLGNVFKLLAAGNRTIAVPTNKPAAGKFQKIIIIHEASGADRTLALTTGSAGAFRFGTDLTGLTATTNGLADYIGCVYNAVDDRWDVVSYVKGY